MLRPNLTAKILAAVGVTVAALIAVYSYFVFRVQSEWWTERTQAQNVISATLVREYLEGVMLSEHHEEVARFLQQLKNDNEIWRGRVIDTNGTVIVSTTTQEIKRVSLSPLPELFKEQRLVHGLREVDGQKMSIVMAPVANRPSCVRCHDPKAAFLGAIVLERSLQPAETNVAKNRNLLILYGALIFLIVGIVIWLLIVRLVAQPVNNVLAEMERVRAGDLAARAPVQSRDEIGRLTEGFNTMVESLQKTTQELRESHERQIQQASKLASIGELASGIAHEIRNPLAGIGAAVEVLADNRGSNNGQDKEIVEEIQRQIHRLNTTLRELLDFSRPREPEITRCDLCDLVKPMLAFIRPDAQKQHIRIVEDCATELPPLWVDPSQIQQVILNILINAVQSMPHGGTLSLHAEADAKTLRLSVSDTGVGISPENLSRVFIPFFTTKHRGTGLGLAIARSIMEKHGGAIRLDSEPGRGTTVTLEFAVGQPETSHAQNQSAGH